jgi:hypothetical protein
MQWVLIYWLLGGYFAPATASVQFDSEAQCKLALKALLSQSDPRITFNGFCIKVGQ